MTTMNDLFRDGGADASGSGQYLILIPAVPPAAPVMTTHIF